MSLAITDDHIALADTVADFLVRHDSRAAARELLESDETNAAFYGEAASLGWLGLHVPEEYGGSGYDLEEAAVVVEQLGRGLAPGAFVSTLVAAGLIVSAGDGATKQQWLPRLVDGSTLAGVALDADVSVDGATASGSASVVVGGGLADLMVLPAGDDVVIVAADQSGVTVETPANIDPSRRAARVRLDGAEATVLVGAAQVLTDIGRTLFAAEATGVARETTEMAAAYAKERKQFGRPIAMFQAVKHHCANMLVATELATANVWDAARAAKTGQKQFSSAAAIAATSAVPAADLCTQLNTQVHGGIGYTWEHDAHLYMRRAAGIAAALNTEAAAIAAVGYARSGIERERTVDLPPEAEPMRDEVRSFVSEVAGLDTDQQRAKMIETGYVMPHWPEPWGRAAGAVEQLVIEQEFGAAGVKAPAYGITGWVILTIIQHAKEDQIERWVKPALNQDVIWCQLFSEPDAGSDAAGVTTRGTRVDGGWLVNGQKVWTSGAHVASFGLATIRTDPEAPKHNGITMMVIEMKGEGVEVRPLKMPTGGSEFNEVFFNDVFVPDDDVVGPVDGGWTVARATLGNESVSIGGGRGGGMGVSASAVIAAHDAHPTRLAGGEGRIGRFIAASEAMTAMNMRSAHRAVAGGAPGPEGNVAKLVLSENGHEAAAMLAELSGPELAYLDGDGLVAGTLVLGHRGMSIAGGTSEIKRNQIGERILGLPRDPLINN